MKGYRTSTATFHFFYTLFFICLGYAAFEYIMIPVQVFSADEFVFGRHIYDYISHLPYRDFPPYKTILGYYLLSIPMYFSHTLLAPLFYIKEEIAALNIICMVIAAVWARRFFEPRAILLTLLAILTNQLFMIYSTDLRVDMLTAWFCLFSMLAILDQRFRLAGFLSAIAFLISQKSLWYFVAINGALVFCRFFFAAPAYSLRAIFAFNLATITTIIAYIITWSLLSSPYAVLYNLFYEAYIQAGIQWYMPIYFFCWQIVLYRGPALYLLWPLTFISLYQQHHGDETAQRRVFILACTSIALALIIHYKQAFPYNSVFTVPAFFILYAAFFSWLFTQSTKLLPAKPSSTLTWIMGVYTVFLFSFIYVIDLPTINYLITLIPLLLCYQQRSTLAYRTILTIFMITGIIYPLIATIIISTKIDGTYQRTMLTLTSQILGENETYVGGIPYLYQKDQSVRGLKNLIGPALDYLDEPKPELKPLFLPSLYLDISTQPEVLEDFERYPVKVLLTNYRMLSLPIKIQTYINEHYQHFYGSIYVYAPIIKPNQLNFHLKFSGRYRVELKNKSSIKLDGKHLANGKILHLKSGNHISEATHAYRLVLIPNIDRLLLRPDYKDDHYLRMVKAILL